MNSKRIVTVQAIIEMLLFHDYVNSITL